MTQQIAIQGGAGSFSHMATLKIFPKAEIKFCATFEEAFLLATQKPELSLVCPCENTVAGRVPEFHSLLRRYSLQIYAEHFEKISHNLLAVKGAKLGSSVKNVHSHIHALGQCRKIILNQKLKEVIESDTAFSAKYVAEKNDKSESAIASELAAQTYNLQILKSKVEDESGSNVTRFLVMGKESRHPKFIKKKKFYNKLRFSIEVYSKCSLQSIRFF